MRPIRVVWCVIILQNQQSIPGIARYRPPLYSIYPPPPPQVDAHYRGVDGRVLPMEKDQAVEQLILEGGGTVKGVFQS